MYRPSSLPQHSPRPRRLRLRAKTIVLTAVLGWVVLGLNAPAWAHTDLEQANPAPGSKVSGGQQAVRLAFTEEIDIDLATVIVRAPNGDDLAQGSPQSVGDAVLQPIDPMTIKGSYEVAYRVVSVDGHPISGSYRFRVTAPARPSGARTAEEAQPPAASPAGPNSGPRTPAAPQDTQNQAQAAEPVGSQTSSTAPLVGGGLALLVIGAGAVLAWRRRSGSTPSVP